MREEADRPPNAPLLNMKDFMRGSISAPLNGILHSLAGHFLASLPQPSSPFLSRLQELALAPPDTSGNLMGLVDLMLKEAKKYVKPEINREAAGFLLNLNYSVSALLTGDKQKEFDALVGISYKKTVTCTLCQYYKTLHKFEPLLQLPVPKKREINIEEEIANYFEQI